jgi:hypothetical protein
VCSRAGFTTLYLNAAAMLELAAGAPSPNQVWAG